LTLFIFLLPLLLLLLRLVWSIFNCCDWLDSDVGVGVSVGVGAGVHAMPDLDLEYADECTVPFFCFFVCFFHCCPLATGPFVPITDAHFDGLQLPVARIGAGRTCHRPSPPGTRGKVADCAVWVDRDLPPGERARASGYG
jgi:hypothetical protein